MFRMFRLEWVFFWGVQSVCDDALLMMMMEELESIVAIELKLLLF